jgi:glycosyltransferase involved in cell wall biosynthesis
MTWSTGLVAIPLRSRNRRRFSLSTERKGFILRSSLRAAAALGVTNLSFLESADRVNEEVARTARAAPVSVLFVIPSLGAGGAERVVVTLLNHLDRTQVRPTLAVITGEGAAYRQDVPEDVDVIDMNCSRVRYAMPRLARLIWRMRPDVVFSTLGHLNLAIGAMRPVLPRDVTYVARETIVVSENVGERRAPLLLRFAYRYLYRGFDKIVCQSAAMRADLQEAFAIPSDKLVTIHNPVDVVRIVGLSARPKPGGESNDANAVELVACGRLEYQKGFDIALHALKLVSDPRIRLTIVGEGSQRQTLMRLAQDLGLGARVEWVGQQRNPYAFIARAAAFLHSSRYEGFPNAVLEALTCGTPVIATPALGDLCETVSGLPECAMAAKAEPEALAGAIRQWLSSARRRFDGPSAVSAYHAGRIAKTYAAVLTGVG